LHNTPRAKGGRGKSPNPNPPSKCPFTRSKNPNHFPNFNNKRPTPHKTGEKTKSVKKWEKKKRGAISPFPKTHLSIKGGVGTGNATKQLKKLCCEKK